MLARIFQTLSMAAPVSVSLPAVPTSAFMLSKRVLGWGLGNEPARPSTLPRAVSKTEIGDWRLEKSSVSLFEPPIKFSMDAKAKIPLIFPALLPVTFQVLAIFAPLSVSLAAPPTTAFILSKPPSRLASVPAKPSTLPRLVSRTEIGREAWRLEKSSVSLFEPPTRFSIEVKAKRLLTLPALLPLMFQALTMLAPVNLSLAALPTSAFILSKPPVRLVSVPAKPFTLPVPVSVIARALAKELKSSVSLSAPPTRFSIEEKVNVPPMLPASFAVMFQVLAISAPISRSLAEPPSRVSMSAKLPAPVAAPLCRFTVTALL